MAQLLSSWNWCEKIWRPEKWILNDIDIKFSMNGRNKNMWVLSCQLFESEFYKLLKIELHNIYIYIYIYNYIYIHTYRVHYHQHGVLGGNGVAGVWSPGCVNPEKIHAILMGKNGDKPINHEKPVDLGILQIPYFQTNPHAECSVIWELMLEQL